MATTKSTKAAVLEDEVVETESTEPTLKQIVNEGIVKVIDATGIDIQKNRYKAMRAIAWQAFVEAIEGDDFEGLVDRAIANVDELPTGWEIEKPAGEEPKPVAKAAPAKKAPAAKAAPAAKTAARKPAAAKAPAASARKRPTR
ncbi:hypothetical protein PBI_POCKET_39 [Microbacterium phage Pocket]|uniref:Uncharacterized protein n=13 Tax=Ilzatvirus TaxID=2560150 RepID=A0A2L0HNL0_9CAUD|nr:hypothetical protein PBI_LUDGATE_40 [Microbacterium phage Ludgate]AUX83316.1 hypothetical protein PBI_SUPERFRESH_40 [Microbacterium phage Superfresh]AVO25217.1 hypothetical protein PBI_GELO_39 [Microbacterium phage Gelo]AVR56242.1 hypothetical protein PBI_DAVE_40 [Microbacterium phage Dave]AVR56457.1 hypothetical protein PBI_RAPTOR_40 [Microbacterium phage Raptor]AVR56645.1 hypothetical protein PBI_ANTOINETTE_40 [Microbacterium phage Antoinette]QDF18992.1 hypothetical protein SEA_ETTA_39 [